GLATPVGTADDDVWYKFVATSTAHTVTLTGTGDYVQELLSGTCAGLTSVAYSDPNVKTYFGLTAGTTYYVRVYSYSATIPSTAAAAFTICVTTPTPPPANDDPCGAVVIPVAAGCTSPTQGSNVSATTTTPSGYTNPGCGIATAPIDVWFKFTTAASGPGSTGVSIITTGTAAGQLRVFSAASCTGPFTQVACKAGTAVNTNAGNLDVSGLTANTTYYVFVSGYSSSDATGAFTLCVTPPPTCATPGSLAVTNVTGTSVTLGWSVSSGTGPFTVNYGPVGFTPGTQGTTTTVTGTSLNVTGLTPGTQYQFYVTQNCGGAAGNSVRVGPVSFSTAALPPTNDECATATTLPVQSGLTCQNQLTGTNVGATGSTGIPAPGCSSYSGGDVWYVVTVPAGGTLTLETDQDSGSNLDDTGLAVYSGTCGALTVVDCNDDGGNGFFSLLTLTGRTPGERLYVRVFEYGNNEFGTFKICARAPSNCPAPSALTATNITTTTATLSWGTSAPTPSGTFDIEYGRQGFILGQGTVVTGLTATTYTLTGLSLDTDYCFYVRQNCGTTSGSSAYTGPECFRTLLPPATNDDPCTALTLPANGTAVTSTTLGATTTAPNGYVNPGCSTSNNPKDVWFRMTTPNGTGATTGTFTLTGSAAGQVRVFTAAACAGPFTQVACRASTGSNLPVGSFTVPGMLPNTTYYLMVAGYGSNDARGTFTIASSFVTATRNELPGGEVSVYPNPSNTGQVTLQLRGAAGVSTATAVLLNSLGQSVRRQVLPVVGGAAEVPLAVQGLAHGVYTLRLQVGDYTVTRKIVLE
ncbi:Por secretion system C-terminal sorting domain-containing protein, partial [Hymenobacter daecheongensis DSM 21074]